MYLVLNTAPAAPLLSLSQAKQHLRVEHTFDDALIVALVASVEAGLSGRDGALHRALITQTWDYKLRAFPASDHIHLPFPPLQSVTHVKYYDGNDAEQTFSSAAYAVHSATDRGYIKLRNSYSWPGSYERDDAVTIRFVCGYGGADDVPAPIKAAALIMLGELYTTRGDNTDGGKVAGGGGIATLANQTAKRLLSGYRVAPWPL